MKVIAAENSRQKSLADVKGYSHAVDELKANFEAATRDWFDHFKLDPSRRPEIMALRREAQEIRLKGKKQTAADKARWEELVILSEAHVIELAEWQDKLDQMQSGLDNLREQLYQRDRKK